jgi:hypothetical protein
MNRSNIGKLPKDGPGTNNLDGWIRLFEILQHYKLLSDNLFSSDFYRNLMKDYSEYLEINKDSDTVKVLDEIQNISSDKAIKLYNLCLKYVCNVMGVGEITDIKYSNIGNLPEEAPTTLDGWNTLLQELSVAHNLFDDQTRQKFHDNLKKDYEIFLERNSSKLQIKFEDYGIFLERNSSKLQIKFVPKKEVATALYDLCKKYAKEIIVSGQKKFGPTFVLPEFQKLQKVTQGAPQMKRMGMYNANVRMNLSRPEMKIFNAEDLNYNNFDS